MLSSADYCAAATWLRSHKRVVLLAHQRPDGDALGALTGTSLLARALGVEPDVRLFDPLSDRYAILHAMTNFRPFDAEAFTQCDGVLIVDTCSLSQLEPARAALPGAPPTLVLDHHITRDDIGTRPGDLRLIDEAASAASLLAAEWIHCAKLPLTPELATALFVGIASDTGWFRHSNTDARTLTAASELVAAGARPAAIYDSLYHRDPVGRLRLAARALASLDLRADGKLAVMTLRKEDFAAAGADETMTEDLVNEAVRLKGTEATLLLIERPDGSVRANLRSKTWLDVAQLAAQFGGGGHARAAGARPNGSWNEVAPRVIEATEAALLKR